MHVRIEADPSIDLVVGYQYAWSIPKQTSARAAAKDRLLSKRSEFWAQLASLLQSFPLRNQVLFLGDLNTSFRTEGSMVGRGIHQRLGSHAPDTSMAQDLLKTFDLTVLNSWGTSGRQACTYIPATVTGHSQIDFAIMRRSSTDQLARCVAPVTLPFVPTTGMRHLPLLGSIPLPRRPTARPAPPMLSRRRVRDLCLQHPQLPDRFRHEVCLLADAQPLLPARELLTQSWKEATATLPRGLPLAPRQADDRSVLRLWRPYVPPSVNSLLWHAPRSAAYSVSGTASRPCKHISVNLNAFAGPTRSYDLPDCSKKLRNPLLACRGSIRSYEPLRPKRPSVDFNFGQQMGCHSALQTRWRSFVVSMMTFSISHTRTCLTCTHPIIPCRSSWGNSRPPWPLYRLEKRSLLQRLLPSFGDSPPTLCRGVFCLPSTTGWPTCTFLHLLSGTSRMCVCFRSLTSLWRVRKH